ncbi:MAG: hypothetical protein Q9207_004219 [Kuettlingeria erythrocarpa]
MTGKLRNRKAAKNRRMANDQASLKRPILTISSYNAPDSLWKSHRVSLNRSTFFLVPGDSRKDSKMPLVHGHRRMSLKGGAANEVSKDQASGEDETVVEPDQGNGQSAQAMVNAWHMWETTELYSRKRPFPSPVTHHFTTATWCRPGQGNIADFYPRTEIDA